MRKNQMDKKEDRKEIMRLIKLQNETADFLNRAYQEIAELKKENLNLRDELFQSNKELGFFGYPCTHKHSEICGGIEKSDDGTIDGDGEQLIRRYK